MTWRELLESPAFWATLLPIVSALATALLPPLSDDEKAKRMAESPRRLAARELAKAVLVDSPKALANLYTLITGRPAPWGSMGASGRER